MKLRQVRTRCGFICSCAKVMTRADGGHFGNAAPMTTIGERAVFSTKPGFEDVTAKLLGDHGHQYWHVVELTTRQPWYLLNYKVAFADGTSMHQTLAIAWESTLASVIAGLEVDAVQALRVLRIAESGQANWTMQEVETLWAPAVSEASYTGPLLFSFKDDPRLYDSHFDIVAASVDGRLRTHSFASSC